MRPIVFFLLALSGVRVLNAAVAGDEIRETLLADGVVVVFAELAPDPLAPDPRPPAHATPAAGHSLEDRAQARLVRFRELQDSFLSEVDETGLDGTIAPDTVEVRYRYRFSPVVALAVSTIESLEALETSPRVRELTPDVSGRAALRESLPSMNVPVVQNFGLSGFDRTVAILDSGVDLVNEDFEDTVVHQALFLDQGERQEDQAQDDYGHGTNIAGIIASRGANSPAGIAPQAKIVAIKVLGEFGSGWVSDWIAGVEHVIEIHDEDNGIEIDAINLSFSSNEAYQGYCDKVSPAFAASCDAAVERGIAVLAASGNGGSRTATRFPGCFESTISVGSVRDRMPSDISDFTDRNEILDLLAPGEVISSSHLIG
ncbi:MAG: S8 family serine peptidase, partial [Planctomycetota bacterium]